MTGDPMATATQTGSDAMWTEPGTTPGAIR
jgi:hypothetical protein